MKLGGIGDYDHIGALDHVLVSIKAGEAAVFRHVNLIRLGALEFLVPGFDPVREDVAHGDQLGSFVCRERLSGGACVAPAATDHTHAQAVAARGIGGADNIQAAQRGGGG